MEDLICLLATVRTLKNENYPNPRTATPVKKVPFLSGDSSWGYDMFCGCKQAWLSWDE